VNRVRNQFALERVI